LRSTAVPGEGRAAVVEGVSVGTGLRRIFTRAGGPGAGAAMVEAGAVRWDALVFRAAPFRFGGALGACAGTFRDYADGQAEPHGRASGRGAAQAAWEPGLCGRGRFSA
jgi:hypothetical protein